MSILYFPFSPLKDSKLFAFPSFRCSGSATVGTRSLWVSTPPILPSFTVILPLSLFQVSSVIGRSSNYKTNEKRNWTWVYIMQGYGWVTPCNKSLLLLSMCLISSCISVGMRDFLRGISYKGQHDTNTCFGIGCTVRVAITRLNFEVNVRMP